MKFRKACVFAAAALGVILLSSEASAHWCDDLWTSSYNIVVRPESDTVTVPASGSANMNIYVQNNMGYQLINFKLGAKVGSTSITPTAPSTLKMANTLLPGEKGIWVLPVTKSGGGSVKIEDITFSVSFGNSGQSGRYPLTGGSPVMVVKTDKTLVPTKPVGLDNASSGGDVAQGRDLQYSAITEFEDANAGLDKLMNFYCSGRGLWGATDGVTPTYCKDATSTTCPTSKPSGVGSKYQYIHLWAAGELAARKSGLGTRLATLRSRFQCGVNDGDVGFAGFPLMMLGYLGEDAGARTFIENVISTGSGDMVGIAKAAILLMGKADDMTKYKADVTTGLKASSAFVAAASATALGIAAKDDTAVSGSLFPLVKWTEPDTSDDGKGMFAAHLLALVAWDRRVWVGNGGDTGAVSFYGDPVTTTGTGGSGPGGAPGVGGSAGGAGATGNRDGGSNDAKAGAGGTGPGGGATGNPGTGGAATANGGATGGGVTGTSSTPGAGGRVSGGGAPGAGGSKATSTSGGVGGAPGSNGGDSNPGDPSTGGATGGSTTAEDTSSGCKCNLGGRSNGATLSMLGLIGLALASAIRRRRRG